ncbi:acyltransferase [Sulfurimonas hydrogeniphila]|uniref:acyltransferase n=1 Tax=Sulfurimonas TaxID=202746 RepID=UPI0024C1AB1F|nr:acyltransferase [Sulfurimonas hydrogeniphila]
MKVINKFKKLFFQLYIAFLSSIPTKLGTTLRYWGYRPFFQEVKGKFNIDTGVTIMGFKNISLGNDIVLMKNSYVYAHDGGDIVIGNNFTMNTNSQLGASFGKIVIGDDCAIAPNCVLRAANHTFDDPNVPFREQGHTYGEIIIEDDVWISSNCVITANTKIGKSSIIGAGSVVTKDVEPYSVMGGVPAKLIRKRK